LSLTYFKATNFRVFQDLEVNLHPQYNLIYGDNASGKTSLLEAIAYLGRGRSFREANTKELLKHDTNDFLLFGKTSNLQQVAKLGLTNGSGGLGVSVNGNHKGGLESLARALPLQIIDPNIHNLVAGSPEERRRFLDWVVFHVEPSYLKLWRNYKRSLKQRNLLLKNNGSLDEIRSWNKGFSGLGESIHLLRSSVFEILEPSLAQITSNFLGDEVNFSYERGWHDDVSLEQALIKNEPRDSHLKSTQVGPHRADISISFDARTAKKQVSRGQQKLLACAMVLGSIEIVQEYTEQPLLLLLDDPAAELDGNSIKKLMDEVVLLGAQVIATSIDFNKTLLPGEPHVFHVEHGQIKQII
jgi:DNA replication and repair protein RecF